MNRVISSIRLLSNFVVPDFISGSFRKLLKKNFKWAFDRGEYHPQVRNRIFCDLMHVYFSLAHLLFVEPDYALHFQCLCCQINLLPLNPNRGYIAPPIDYCTRHYCRPYFH